MRIVAAWSHRRGAATGIGEVLLRIGLPYDEGSLSLEFGSRGDVTILQGNPPPPLPDPTEALRRALDRPIGTPAFDSLVPPSGIVSVLVSDITRSGAVAKLLPPLLSRLEGHGATAERVQIILALGMHRGHRREEIESHLGRDVAASWPIYDHDARNTGSLIDAGTTSSGTPCFFNRRAAGSRLVVTLGSLSFHYFAGFGGARKLILPGIAGEKTIVANHRLSLKEDPRDGLCDGCRPGNVEGNPVHDDMLEGARLLPVPVFAINTIADGSGKIVFVNAGDLDASHRAGCESLRERFCIPLERPFRAVIASAGGYPKDMNLLQSHKAVRHASRALGDGGTLLMAAACREGIGSESLDEAFVEGRDAVPGAVARRYTLNAQAALSLHELTGRYAIFLKSMIGDAEVSRFGFRRWDIDRAEALLDGIPDEEICVLPEAATFLPMLQ